MALPGQPVGLYYLVSRYAYDARLEDVTPGTSRHAFGKNIVDARVGLDRVARMMGGSRSTEGVRE